ncbi:MAG: hypothetical protein ACK515_03620 [bacterium]|jgi:hypothetical protein|nr:hypothetical protein [Betaproteobacteria bacterium]
MAWVGGLVIQGHGGWQHATVPIWSQTSPDFGDTFASAVVFSVGHQGPLPKDNANWLCWPVHDGDVAALPRRK